MELAALFQSESSIFLLLGISFLGGLIASISPCSLSMLPIIIGYVGGYSDERPHNILIQMLFFIVGASVVFTSIGVVCALTGKVFVTSPYLRLLLLQF